MSLAEGIRTAEAVEGDITTNAPRFAMNLVDVLIQEVYLPFRGASGYGTERAVLVEPPHTPHRENDAEHSWHLAVTCRTLWDEREELGIKFPDGFDIETAVQMAIDHDMLEIWAGDVNAMTRDPNLIALKHEKEKAARETIRAKMPFLVRLADRLEEYELKESPEAKYVSDIDKILPTRIIFLDGGKKWHDWEGDYTSRDRMVLVVRGKLKTSLGHSLMDIMERDIERNPNVFPCEDDADDVNVQMRFPV